MAAKKRRPNRAQPKTATWIFVLAILVIAGGMGVKSLFFSAGRSSQIPTYDPSHASSVHLQQRRFIEKMAPAAVKVYQKNRRVLPSIVIAQAILESDWGRSQLYLESNNPFGMKGSYNGQTKLYPTAEVYNGKKVMVKDYFRVYPTLQEAIGDHDAVVAEKFVPVGTTDYEVAARALQNNGYATDPHYARKIIHLIQTYRLNQFDS